jgi:hypothetical protein
VAEEKQRTQEAKIVDAGASAEAQAEMMGGLCDELKKLEEVRPLTEQNPVAWNHPLTLLSSGSMIAIDQC